MYYPRYDIFATEIKNHFGNGWFTVAELPEDLRVYRLHRKAISQGFVRRVGFCQGVRSNQTVGIWKVTL